jgi:hypothetical protein
LEGAGRRHQGLYRVRVGERQPGQINSQVPRVADELDWQRVAQLATLR